MAAGLRSSRNVERDVWRRVLTMLCHCRVTRRLDNYVMRGRAQEILLLWLLVLLVWLVVLDSFNRAD